MKNRFKFIFERAGKGIVNFFYLLFARHKIYIGNSAPGGYLDFYKLAGGWYADVRTWTGSVQNLQMVAGADELLEYLSEGDHVVRLKISREDNGGLHLVKIEDIYDGADYRVVNCPECGIVSLWLCGVNNFYWGGEAPDDIWFNRIPYKDEFSE